MSAAEQATVPAPAPRLKLPLPDRPAVRPRAESRLRALDALRLLAALMVCFYHYAGKNGDVVQSWHQSPATKFPTLSQFATYGSLGVQFFFLISGFVICMSSWGRSMGDFFRSRVARLYPAYWVAIVLVTAASIILPVVVEPLRSDEILVNLTMLQQPMGVPRVLGVDWTLWVELRFYAMFALFVVWRGVTYRRVVLFCCLWTLAGVFARVADNPLTDELVMRDHAPYFIGGLAFYLIHRYGNDLLLWGIVVMSFLLGQRYSVTALWHPGPQGAFHRNPHVIQLIVLVAFVAVAAVALGWTSRANWRWLTVAGALTYPFYLVHEHLGWFVIRGLYRGLGLNPMLTFGTTILIMLGLAWLLHRFVEKPFGPRLKRALVVRRGEAV
ncbi:acyltransferase family protein [Streptomyces chiangmaiensis]|uniref:Acyltransferase n=1 Tax=Streptomyces chiangmaiensis TaxID=766497 RepID=A0ABU7FNQ4_9ACTN|nr:acyltransferase [Streptomyces chiangmaiensis]MED7825756.1 acyltransferase [Streptomyces chiangmaiensis]